jgi:N-acetylglucosaminyldiphosphoundecaprenol N-acetyl-beta-D-mannosaminyltransferase
VTPRYQQILGVRFFNGSAIDAVEHISRHGGLVVAPAAPSMVNLKYDKDYRHALAAADLAIADSGWVVLLWKLITGRRLARISGLEFVKRLLEHETMRRPGSTVWVLPSESARNKTIQFLKRAAIPFLPENFYVAPRYQGSFKDEILLAFVQKLHPAHIVIAIGGGNQDKLGRYLKGNLDYRPAIHCIGAALGFLTGDQVAIPEWADRFYLGWLLRMLTQPRIFIPRLWAARELPWMMVRYRHKLPPLRKAKSERSAQSSPKPRRT